MRKMVGGVGGGRAADDEIITFALPVIEKNNQQKWGTTTSHCNAAVSKEDYVARGMWWYGEGAKCKR
jgi:hypothetical protein